MNPAPHEAVILTAWRSGRSNEVNLGIMALLKRHIERMGLAFKHVYGYSKEWGSEPAYIVYHPSFHKLSFQELSNLEDLAWFLEQDAILKIDFSHTVREIHPHSGHKVVGVWCKVENDDQEALRLIRDSGYSAIGDYYYVIKELPK